MNNEVPGTGNGHTNGNATHPPRLEDARTLLTEKTKLTGSSVTLDVAHQLRNKDVGKPKPVEKSYTDIHHHGGSDTEETSYMETLMNLVKGYLGCGMLAMGEAYKNGGWLSSTLFLIFFAIICCYNQYHLIWLAAELQKQFKLDFSPTFGDTIGLAFESGHSFFKRCATIARKLVVISIVLTQLGFCCVYFLFISRCLQQLCRMYDTQLVLDMRVALLIVLPVIIVGALIRNLKYLAPLSVFANVTMLCGVVIIIYNSMWDLPPISTRTAIGSWSGISLFIGTAIYTFEGISLVLPLQQNMKKREKFTGSFGILNITMGAVTLIVFLLGFVGYMKYGNNVRESLTLNLNEDFLSTKILIVCMMFGIICTYGLQFYIPVVLITPTVTASGILSPLSETVQEYIIRLILVLLTFSAAELIPHLDLFISLIGAVGGTLLALVLPSLAYIAHRPKSENGILAWRFIVDMLSILLGIVSFSLGTYFSLVAIIDTFRKDLGFV